MMRNSFTWSRVGSLLAGILLAGVFVFTLAPLARAQEGSIAVPKVLKWRNLVGSASEYDSTYKQLNGATQMLDTTQTINTNDWAWERALMVSPSTPASIAKLFIRSSSGTIASVDSLFYAIDGSYNGTQWYQLTAFTGIVLATSGDAIVGVAIVADADAPVGNLWLVPYLRFRFRADGNTSATYPNAQASIVYLKRKSSF